jgi:hypothetical protein
MPDLKHKLYLIVMLALTFCFGMSSGFAHTEELNEEKKPVARNSQVTDNNDNAKQEDKRDEFVLDEILIEAVIDKPNVAILPSLELGDLGDILFIDRSFEEELKAVPRGLFVVDDKAEQKKSIERLKTLLKQKRK